MQIAWLKGAKVAADFMPLMLKRLTWTGSTLRPRSVEEKGAIARALEAKVWPLLAAGKVRPLILATFPLAEAAARRMRSWRRASTSARSCSWPEPMAAPAPLARCHGQRCWPSLGEFGGRRRCRHGSSCPTKPPTALTLDQIEGVLERRDGVVWVHLNATATPAKQWIRSCTHLPEPIREDLLETDPRTRLEPLRSAVVGVIGDTVAGADPDPSRLATLHFYLDRQCLISTRRRPVSCASRLGQGGSQWAVGKQLRRTPGLAASPRCSVDQRARDRVGAGRRPQRGRRPGGATPPLRRQRLGKARRRAAQLRRQVTLRPRAIDRLRARLPQLDQQERPLRAVGQPRPD